MTNKDNVHFVHRETSVVQWVTVNFSHTLPGSWDACLISNISIIKHDGFFVHVLLFAYLQGINNTKQTNKHCTFIIYLSQSRVHVHLCLHRLVRIQVTDVTCHSLWNSPICFKGISLKQHSSSKTLHFFRWRFK